eukprot:5581852-Pyramimonas_sp.AAC.1
MTAKDLCLNCYWADKAGAKGPFSTYALGDTQFTGNYQKKLNTVFKLTGDVHQVKIDIPLMRNKHDRESTPTLVTPPQEALAA